MQRGDLLDWAQRYKGLWTDGEISDNHREKLDVFDEVLTTLGETAIPRLEVDGNLLCVGFKVGNPYLGRETFVDLVGYDSIEPEYGVNVIVRTDYGNDGLIERLFSGTKFEGHFAAKKQARVLEEAYSIARRYDHFSRLRTGNSVIGCRFGGLATKRKPEDKRTKRNAIENMVKFITELKEYTP
tara:strand:+ start:337 stop:888 length:552 start_codon:yes stop_codon:yes gene_type:complete